jgi:hypothetical protein
MTRRPFGWWRVAPAWAAFAALVLLPAAASAGAAASSHSPSVTSVTLDIHHRIFQNFSERRQVRLNEDFRIGDTDFSARVVQYVPDFTMDINTRKVTTRSQEPRNPAFRIIVREKKVPQDTTWALLRMPPHFARKSMLAFQVQRIDFFGHEPLVRSDSVAVAKPVSMPPAPAQRTTR